MAGSHVEYTQWAKSIFIWSSAVHPLHSPPYPFPSLWCPLISHKQYNGFMVWTVPCWNPAMGSLSHLRDVLQWSYKTYSATCRLSFPRHPSMSQASQRLLHGGYGQDIMTIAPFLWDFLGVLLDADPTQWQAAPKVGKSQVNEDVEMDLGEIGTEDRQYRERNGIGQLLKVTKLNQAVKRMK